MFPIQHLSALSKTIHSSNSTTSVTQLKEIISSIQHANILLIILYNVPHMVVSQGPKIKDN